jgi:hypothetical protein
MIEQQHTGRIEGTFKSYYTELAEVIAKVISEELAQNTELDVWTRTRELVEEANIEDDTQLLPLAIEVLAIIDVRLIFSLETERGNILQVALDQLENIRQGNLQGLQDALEAHETLEISDFEALLEIFESREILDPEKVEKIEDIKGDIFVKDILDVLRNNDSASNVRDILENRDIPNIEYFLEALEAWGALTNEELNYIKSYGREQNIQCQQKNRNVKEILQILVTRGIYSKEEGECFIEALKIQEEEAFKLLNELLEYKEGRALTIDYNGEERTLLQVAVLKENEEMIRFILDKMTFEEKKLSLCTPDAKNNILLSGVLPLYHDENFISTILHELIDAEQQGRPFTALQRELIAEVEKCKQYENVVARLQKPSSHTDAGERASAETSPVGTDKKAYTEIPALSAVNSSSAPLPSPRNRILSSTTTPKDSQPVVDMKAKLTPISTEPQQEKISAIDI